MNIYIYIYTLYIIYYIYIYKVLFGILNNHNKGTITKTRNQTF